MCKALAIPSIPLIPALIAGPTPGMKLRAPLTPEPMLFQTLETPLLNFYHFDRFFTWFNGCPSCLLILLFRFLWSLKYLMEFNVPVLMLDNGPESPAGALSINLFAKSSADDYNISFIFLCRKKYCFKSFL